MTAPGEGQPPKATKLMDSMRAVLRVQRYALRTEQDYPDWVRHQAKFHGPPAAACENGAQRINRCFPTSKWPPTDRLVEHPEGNPEVSRRFEWITAFSRRGSQKSRAA